MNVFMLYYTKPRPAHLVGSHCVSSTLPDGIVLIVAIFVLVISDSFCFGSHHLFWVSGSWDLWRTFSQSGGTGR